MTAAAPPADLVGQRIDDWNITSRLGGGGMGVVYEAKTDQGDRVAIKTLKPAFANDRELVGRFLGEARALKAIRHRAMVDILSIGELGDGTHYMVMEFLEGRSFEEVIAKGAPLDPREVMTWMVEILDALEAVHAAGVIHRDLKPSNLYLARNGSGAQVKLIDFGIAKHTGSSGHGAPKTLVSAIVGTPDYMSPEQVNGEPVTAASDLYALGCVMFEMLTGKLPFEEESSVKKMLSHVERPAPRASSVLKTLPRAIDDLVEWTMHKEPARRPASARALKERIEELLDGELGGTGPAATKQLKAIVANDLASPPAVTEPSMPAVQAPDSKRGRRSRTEPVPRLQRKAEVPVWALGLGGVLLLGLVLFVVSRLTRTPEHLVPLPPAQVQTPEPGGEATPAAVAQPDPKPPPDRPVPKRKKPTPPARKKTTTKRR